MKVFEALLIPVSLSRGCCQLINASVLEQFNINVLYAKSHWYNDKKDTDLAHKKLAAMEPKVYLELDLKLIMPSP